MHQPRSCARTSICLLSGLLAAGLFAPRPLLAAERTNIIIIFCDDLGAGDLGVQGHPEFKTPRIDRLAAEGARLTSFYSTCPYCAPSRASLQTGRYQVRSGVVTNPTPDGGINDVGIPASELTLGELFQRAGYATCCIGKWHLGHKPEFHPLRHGYDTYYGILYSNDMRPVELWDDDKIVEYPVAQATLTRRYTERAIAFIERRRDQPFFLYLPHAMPHKPLAASDDFYRKSGAGLYGDVIAELDWSVGRIVDTLQKLGIDERTLLLFTSDNGPWYGGSTGGLRGMKGQSWEGGIRVPMIARWPGRIPAGVVSAEPAMMPDLFTTALAVAGIAPPADRPIDGRDIMPLFAGPGPGPHQAIFSFSMDRLMTVRSGDWKLLLHAPPAHREKVWQPDDPYTDPRAPDGVTILAPFEQMHPSRFPGIRTGDPVRAPSPGLFNLKEDPSEQHDVADQHPDVVERLRGYATGFQASLQP